MLKDAEANIRQGLWEKGREKPPGVLEEATSELAGHVLDASAPRLSRLADYSGDSPTTRPSACACPEHPILLRNPYRQLIGNQQNIKKQNTIQNTIPEKYDSMYMTKPEYQKKTKQKQK